MSREIRCPAILGTRRGSLPIDGSSEGQRPLAPVASVVMDQKETKILPSSLPAAGIW